MNILLVGSGGREHALAWKIKQSPLTKSLFIAPGNPGTASLGENIPVKAEDFAGLTRVCIEKKIDLIVVGPEGPLVEGIREHFESNTATRHVLLVGPGKAGAQLEGSKDFSKKFMMRHGVPTADARTFTAAQLDEGLEFLDRCKLPIVLKADGLAAGKGVIICHEREEARLTLQDMLGNKRFGAASSRVLVETFLDGIELSVFVLTDGENYALLPEAKDYKRIGEKDTGPNTGGMGAVSPVPFATAEFMKKVSERIIKPTISGLKKESIPYKGFIFFGLINVKGEPFVIEYNARMGDPETEAVMPRIDSDLVELLAACAKGDLGGRSVSFRREAAHTVVMVSGGYPGDYKKGKEISGLDRSTGALVFHAGTKQGPGGPVTDGGRVLAVTGLGTTPAEAREVTYGAISPISWEGVYFRRDIGVDLQGT